MFKILLLLAVCIGLFANGESSGLSTLLHRKSTTTEQPEQNTAATATATNNSDRLPAGYYKSNNLPKVEEEGCKIVYDCKKKLKTAENPRPCVKFCAKAIDCDNEKGKRRIAVAAGQCLELNEEMVAQEYNDCKKDESSTLVPFMQVAMIDFPCQPGYLPDSRGRCREVW